MKKNLIIWSVIILAIVVVAGLKYLPGTSSLVWNLSGQGTWLLPLVLLSSLLDSVHPCSFSILLLTISFLLALHLPRKKIWQIGGVYIAGIFTSYLFIGLGILKVLHIFNTPHFMGKLGAFLLVVFGAINLLNYFFPKFPIKLKLPGAVHGAIGQLMYRVSVISAFTLGVLVGICQFPCMGGPYLMVIGLLRDQVTYFKGFVYLLIYNLILIIPLIAVLFMAADQTLLGKIQAWRREEMSHARLWIGVLMIVIGLLIFAM